MAEGEFLSIIGPSGCGKTTILRLIAGLEEPTRGEVAGRPLAGGENGLAYVFQEPTLMPWASVADNVRLPLRIEGTERGEAARRVAAMLDLVGLSAFASAYPHALSGGMKMRVAIARALATRPRLLLMDEPFAALDEITRFRLNEDLLAIVGKTRCTVVFVTHSVYESAWLSTRIAVMSPRPGRIVSSILVDLPRAREDATRRDPRYLAVTEAASAALRAAGSAS